MQRCKSFVIMSLIVASFSAGCATDDVTGDEDGELTVTAEDQIEDDVFNQMSADSKQDAALSYQAVARLARNAGMACTGERIAVAVAVARAESSFRPSITNTAGNAHGIDRGLWQINSYWHPEVSASCALSPSCNARAAYRISSKGTNWNQWWTWKNKKHLPFMSQARVAQNAVCP